MPLSDWTFYLEYPTQKDKRAAAPNAGRLGNHKGNVVAVRNTDGKVVLSEFPNMENGFCRIGEVEQEYKHQRLTRINRRLAQAIHPRLFDKMRDYNFLTAEEWSTEPDVRSLEDKVMGMIDDAYRYGFGSFRHRRMMYAAQYQDTVSEDDTIPGFGLYSITDRFVENSQWITNRDEHDGDIRADFYEEVENDLNERGVTFDVPTYKTSHILEDTALRTFEPEIEEGDMVGRIRCAYEIWAIDNTVIGKETAIEMVRQGQPVLVRHNGHWLHYIKNGATS